MRTITFDMEETLWSRIREYGVKNQNFSKRSGYYKLNRLVSLGLNVLVEMDALKEITQELGHNNLTIDNEDVINELPVRINIKLDQLKKFNNMAKKENLPINKLMSIILTQYIDRYYYMKKRLSEEDILAFRKHAIDKIAIKRHGDNQF